MLRGKANFFVTISAVMTKHYGNACVSVIAALSKENNGGGIGYRNTLPWTQRLHIDMSFFKFITSTQWKFCGTQGFAFQETSNLDSSMDQRQTLMENHLIMGRKTFESLVDALGDPPFTDNRKCMVISSTVQLPK